MPDIMIQQQRFYYPVGYVLQLIGGTWKEPVHWRLRKKSLRYSKLENDIPNNGHKMLSKEGAIDYEKMIQDEKNNRP